MLFMVWVAACWPFVWVMVVVVGVFWWRVFQCWVAVVLPSSVVPGVVWGVCVLVVATCVVWFRMLMCVAVSFLFCLLFG